MIYRNPCRCKVPIESGGLCRRCGGRLVDDQPTAGEDYLMVGAVSLILLGIVIYILTGSHL